LLDTAIEVANRRSNNQQHQQPDNVQQEMAIQTDDIAAVQDGNQRED
jgi:hypothetical protein